MHAAADTVADAPEVPVEPTGPARPPGLARDLLTLSKPGILTMCIVMAAGGAGLAAETGHVAGGSLTVLDFVWLMLGTAMSVASANTFNMVIERDGDRHMARTMHRPLAARRMPVWQALGWAAVNGVASVAVLWIGVNALTAALSAFALFSYVCIYTPMKRMSWWSLIVGAIPGAMPPLMGWTAATGEIGAPGLVLFLILAVWQLPHFIAISLYRLRDFNAAGIKTVPGERGDESAKLHALGYTLLLVPVSMLLVPIGAAGFFYFVVCGVLGVWFAVLSLQGLEPRSGTRWARAFFLASIVYLPALTVGLVIDVWLS